MSYQRKLMAQNSAATTQPGTPSTGPTNKAPAWAPPDDNDRNQFTPGWDINPYN